MDRQEIPVVWGADKNYILQAFVVMRSILQHSGEQYHFFILTADQVEDEAETFVRMLRQEFCNFKVSVKLLDDVCFAASQINNQHLSKAAYFRLLIPEVLREYKKCIYLDCDLLVHGDLEELYHIELEDYYLAGVKDCHIIADTSYEREHERVLGIPSRERYINSGVMLMNLDKLRRDGLTARFLEQLTKENWYEDQDVLNVCCYPFIKILPLKYNLLQFYLGANIKYLRDLPYDREDFEFDPGNPYILHMGGAYKAWDGYHVKGDTEWWRLAGLFSTSVSYQFYRNKCVTADGQDEILDMIERAKKSRHIVIWGYGENGKHLCDILSEYSIDHITAFVDNNDSLWGEQYRGIPVRGFDSVSWEEDTLWLVSCRVFYRAVIQQLKEHGTDEHNILRFNNVFMDSLFLYALEKGAYDNMIYRISNREYVKQFPGGKEREQHIRNIIENPLQYETEYAYLADKYRFCDWLDTWQEEG